MEDLIGATRECLEAHDRRLVAVESKIKGLDLGELNSAILMLSDNLSKLNRRSAASRFIALHLSVLGRLQLKASTTAADDQDNVDTLTEAQQNLEELYAWFMGAYAQTGDHVGIYNQWYRRASTSLNPLLEQLGLEGFPQGFQIAPLAEEDTEE